MADTAAAAAAADKKKGGGASSSEYEDELSASSSSDGGDGGREAALFGGLRTRLRVSPGGAAPGGKAMHLDVRQTLQTGRRVELRARLALDPQTGAADWTAQLSKTFSQNTPVLARLLAAERGYELRGEERIDPSAAFLPGGLKTLLFRDFTLSPGLRATSLRSIGGGRSSSSSTATDSSGAAAAAGGAGGGGGGGGDDAALRYFLTLRKQPQVLRRRGAWDAWLSGKADLELDPSAQATRVRGGVRLRLFRYALTARQDLQLALGYDCDSSGAGAWGSSAAGRTVTPFFKLAENRWALKLARDAWRVNYDF